MQATSAGRSDAIAHELAAGLIESWTRFRVQEMNLEVLRAALRIRQIYRFSFWDSAIVAAALTLGCDRIYTEDLADGQSIDGVRVVNPFH